jgi:hypothetical protein
MDTVTASGLVVTLGGLGGYLVGLTVAYPGRAFSVTAVIVGLTLFAIGRPNSSEGGP